MMQGHYHLQGTVQPRRDPDQVRRVSALIASLLPRITYTALAVVLWVGHHPLLVHTHPKDYSSLTGKMAFGDLSGGETV